MNQNITISLSPNVEFDDVVLALRLLISRGKWSSEEGINNVIEWFNHQFPDFSFQAVNAARSGLFLGLKSLGVGVGDEVITQAFTCVAVPNAVKWTGAKVIFADIDDHYNVDPNSILSKITSKTKAVIVQHTFGIPANLKMILDICKKHKLLLIEDCAHGLGATSEGNPLGSFGDLCVFSFGRDKVVSSVWGGVVGIRKKHSYAIEQLNLKVSKLPRQSTVWVVKQLLYPVLYQPIAATYGYGIGKLLAYLLVQSKFVSVPVYEDEKKGMKPISFPSRFPNILGFLALHQLQKLDYLNQHRCAIARLYDEHLRGIAGVTVSKLTSGAIYLRYPIRLRNAQRFLSYMKKKGIYLGNWYHNGVDPYGVDFKEAGYDISSCKNAIKVSQECINLPTHIHVTSDCAMTVIRSIQTYENYTN